MKIIVYISLIIFGLNFSAHSQYKTYKGSGDDFIRLEKPDNGLPALMGVVGNLDESHFAITGYSDNNEKTDLFVNTTEYYEGIVAIDLPINTLETEWLEIKASSDWVIGIYSLGQALRIEQDEAFEGNGDNVLWVNGEVLFAQIEGNALESHFAIITYSKSLEKTGLLVNTTKKYLGKVRLPKETLFIEIKAEGNWTIILNN